MISVDSLKKNRTMVITILILVLLFFGIENQIELATDSYDVLMNDGSWKWMLFENGRLIDAVIYYTFEKLCFSDLTKYTISYIVALVCLIVAIYFLAEEIDTYIPQNKVKSAVIAFCTISNPFIIEYFLFIEKGLFMLAILLNVMAFKMIIKYMKMHKKFYVFYAFIFLVSAVFIYQISLEVFVILCLPFIFINSKNVKEFLKNNIIIVLLYITSMSFNYLFTVVLLASSRVDTGKNMISRVAENLPDIFIKFNSVIQGSELVLGKNTLLIAIYSITGCFIIQMFFICSVKKERERIVQLLGLGYIWMVIMFTGLFPWLTGMAECKAYRTTYPCIYIVGVLLIYDIMINSNGKHISYDGQFAKKWWKIRSVVVSIVIVLLLVKQYQGFNMLFINRYVTNRADMEYSREVQYEIEKHEKKSGKKIQYIAIYYDAEKTWQYPKCDNMAGIKATCEEWSDVNSLNYYLDTSYIKIDSTDLYTEYFSHFNWHTYCAEQLQFEGDTLHLCVY